jgi:hypothetical protein
MPRGFLISKTSMQCCGSIPDPNFSILDLESRVKKIPDPGSGSTSKNLSIFNQINWFPDPDLDFFTNTGSLSQKVPDPGSGSATQNQRFTSFIMDLLFIAASIGTEVLRYYCRAGLFGSKCDLSMQISPLGCRLVSALSIPIGEWHKSPADFNPNHNHVNAAPETASLQTTSRPHHQANPKQNTACTMYSSNYQSVK